MSCHSAVDCAGRWENHARDYLRSMGVDMIQIGIDPGVTTGIAMLHKGELTYVASMQACEAERMVLLTMENGPVFVWFEDARMRQWFGSKGREVLQGAGSVKRDCQRWAEWLLMNQIPHDKVAPKNNRTKLTADKFKKLTGWQGRTNEHSRDAAMLVFGRSSAMTAV